MKLGRGTRISVWFAIFIAVLSLAFTVWQGHQMSQTSQVIQRISERLDYFEVSQIREKLASPQAKIFMSKWRDCAARRALVYRRSVSPQVYEVTQSGRDLVNTLEPGLFQWLFDRKEDHREEKMQDILYAVNIRDLHGALYNYNINHDTSIPLESVFGILVAHLEPSPQLP